MAEERTTEKDRKRIMEGKTYYMLDEQIIMPRILARRKAAEGKRRYKTEEEELAGKPSPY